MAELIRQLADTPLPLIFIGVGTIFLFLAAGGRFGATVIADKIRPVFAGTVGLFFVIAGIVMHYRAHPEETVSAMEQRQPTVIRTVPENGATGVEGSLRNISVTFDRGMADGCWSWVAESAETFPEVTGEPAYSDDRSTCSLPVKLEEGKTYVILINSPERKNFKDEQGVPAKRYRLTFTTERKAE